ncbi:hypothetical protein BCR35DRAFT_354280 [Leucosporidium creatinivorum]|uniref:Uncharacterized protein n=1 Tax=Leucosporidium creatinivorum TaxID=106004 RepID=A0A1Y2EP04_9BASI|nr:hypothetical protein BCR35DRAFT_354280 [Leucosporidium creatinivorum]
MDDYSAPPPYEQSNSTSQQCSTAAVRPPDAPLRPFLNQPQPAAAPNPRRYPINGHQVRLLGIEELYQHLALLHAFRALRQRVETSDELDRVSVGGALWGELSQGQKWRTYVTMAVHAFESYVAGGMKEEPSAEILLCWYAHLLHPDRDIAVHGLLPDDVRPIPPSMIKRFINNISILGDRGYSAASGKEKASASWADPLDLVRRSSTVLVDSPHFAKPVSIPWIDGGHGFAEPGFAIPSNAQKDGRVTTHETLAIYRLCRDLVRWREDKTSYPRAIIKTPEAHDWLFGRNLFIKYPLKTLDAKGMGHLFNWTKTGFLAFLEKQVAKDPVVGKGPWTGRAKIRELNRMVDSYQRGENLTFNLHALLDSSWLEEPLLLGWDEQTSAEILEVAVARYHAACDLIVTGFEGDSRRLSTLHPTLDIVRFRLDPSLASSRRRRLTFGAASQELAIRTLQLSTRAEQAYHSHLGASRAGSGKANAEGSFVRTAQAWEVRVSEEDLQSEQLIVLVLSLQNRFSAPYSLTVSPPSDSKLELSARNGAGYESDWVIYVNDSIPRNLPSAGQATFALTWRIAQHRREGGAPRSSNTPGGDSSAMNSGAGSQMWLGMTMGGR